MSKMQHPSSKETPRIKLQEGGTELFRRLKFGASLDVGAWHLEFFELDLLFQQPVDCSRLCHPTFQRTFGRAEFARSPDIRWDTALRDLQIQLEPRVSRGRIEVES